MSNVFYLAVVSFNHDLDSDVDDLKEILSSDEIGMIIEDTIEAVETDEDFLTGDTGDVLRVTVERVRKGGVDVSGA